MGSVERKEALEYFSRGSMIGYTDAGTKYKGISLVAGQSHRLLTEEDLPGLP